MATDSARQLDEQGVLTAILDAFTPECGLTPAAESGRFASTMVAIGPVSGIQMRIDAIRQRMAGPGTVAGPQATLDFEAVAPDPVDAGFDPFGEVYQQAVEAARLNPQSAGSATATVDNSLAMFGLQFSATGMPGASAGRIGGFGTMPVPSDLLIYGNGQIPGGVLQPIGQGRHALYGPAAAAWSAAVEAAAADGIRLRVTDSYRTYDQQVQLVENKGLYSEGGYGATPGTSNHGWGLAVDADVSDPATLAWLRSNGHRFGFVEAVPREPWHWEYRPAQA
jgi:zinc D-Ala-D-Ala carboxypeptidase